MVKSHIKFDDYLISIINYSTTKMNYNTKLNTILSILTINFIVLTLFWILLVNVHKYYYWIVSIIILNIQTIIYYTFISWKFYKSQCVYKHYLVSVIFTSILTGLMMWLHRNLVTFDLLSVIIMLLAVQIASIFDIIVYRSVRETFITYKKSV